MINPNNSFEIISALDAELYGGSETPTDPNEMTDYDLEDALSQVEREMGASRTPTLDIFLALAWDGYGQESQIWDAIYDAARDALREYAEDRWQQYLEEQDEDEDWDE